MKGYWWFVLVLPVLLYACAKDGSTAKITVVYNNGPTDSLKINQYTVIASHNSYHKKGDSAVLAFLFRLDSLGYLPSQYDPTALDYAHEQLTEQLSTYGLRGLELDVWYDPEGGNFYKRYGLAYVGLDAESHIDALLQPGFKLQHIPDFDYNSTNLTFVDALTEIKKWSDANPNHIPVFINVETESETAGDIEPSLLLTKSVPWDAAAADALDAEVKSVFGNNLDGVITPDNVRGNYSTLEEAVLAGNWPKLADARGKVIFIVNSDGNTGSIYKAGHPSLQGRAMFLYVNSPGKPEAAFVLMNGPTGSSFAKIQQYVKQGYIVRTMADEGTTQARTGDYTKADAALGSFAQIVSTDYYHADARAGTTGWTDYHVTLPGGGIARIDSLSAPGMSNLGTIKE